MNSCCEDITVLGGGASGICVGYYASKSGLNFKIHEATDTVGGNATTIQFKDFRFDTGAHRWHDRYPDITAELKSMMGHDLKQIHVPSHIFHNNMLVDFPLSPLNLLKSIGPFSAAKAGFEVLINSFFNGDSKTNFEDFARNTYGRSIADRFLTNYSEKLWGLPCRKLSSQSAGKRMNGLNLKTFILEALYGSKAKTEHLDGSFYYPKYGIADIVDKWIDICGKENIVKHSKITKILHDDKEILSMEINGIDKAMISYAVTTLPISHLLNMLTPSPPKEILGLANSLIYRHIKLVALFIDKPSVTASATVYFPDKEFIFTRLYEPKNRSINMSPEAHTSLIVEIPCQYGSRYWEMEDRELINKVTSKLIEIGWINKEEIMDALVYPLYYAYPVFEVGYEDKIKGLFNYLRRFRNLAFAGRNSRFEYIHLHDIMKSGKEIVENYKMLLKNSE
jgi:protoporphyrinogen oxidase